MLEVTEKTCLFSWETTFAASRCLAPSIHWLLTHRLCAETALKRV